MSAGRGVIKTMLLCCFMMSLALVSGAARPPMIEIDFEHITGDVKPIHGIGQGPLVDWDDTQLFALLNEAGIPYSRLHDVGGALGGARFVDIPNVFPNFDADENDPKNYDFSFTDEYLRGLVHNGVEPYYRLGVTIENVAHKHHPMRIMPPKDFSKWARICEKIIQHYTEGWANGFKWKITYWEIWNEPETDFIRNAMWTGTPDEYFKLYEVTSKHLKAKFPHLKIGGYASSGFFKVTQSAGYRNGGHARKRGDYLMSFFERFVDYVKQNNCPLDFFSFHAYDSPENYVEQARFVRKYLNDRGFIKTEIHCNEWLSLDYKSRSPELAAQIAAMLVAFQNGPTDLGMIYDGKCGMSCYSPLFDASGMVDGSPSQARVTNAYFAFLYFNELYKLGKSIPVRIDIDGIWATAATDGKGNAAVLVVNVTDKSVTFRNGYLLEFWQPGTARLCSKDAKDVLMVDPWTIPAHAFKLIRFRKMMDDKLTLTKENVEIVIDKDASPVIKYAANELKLALDGVFSANVPIVSEPSPDKVPVVLGDEPLSARDEFHVNVSSRGVKITGVNDSRANPLETCSQFLWPNNYERATLFGVYEFTERFAGCRYYFEGELGTIFPKTEKLVIPYCEYRKKPLWTTRRYFPGDNCNWRQTYRHRMDTFFYPHCHGNAHRRYLERFSKDHPEYFTLLEDGTRRISPKIAYPGHFCHSSDIWNEIYLDAKCFLLGGKCQDRGIVYPDSGGWRCEVQRDKDGIGYFDVMNQDEMMKCACEKCKAISDEPPDFASTLIWKRTAEIAQRLIDERIPGYLCQMAYSPYRRVPENVNIPTNVLVMVAGGGPWTVNSQDTFDNDINAYRDWTRKLGRKVRSWSYPLKFWYTKIPDIPCSAPRAWGRYFKDAAPYLEGAYAESWVDRPLYNHLNHYIFSRIGWDADVDVDATLDEYFRLMYGPAAHEMKEFFDSLEQKWVYELVLPRSSLGCGGPGFKAADRDVIWRKIYSEDVIAHYEMLFATAEKKVAANSLEARRLALIKAEFLEPLTKAGRLYRSAKK